MKKTFPINTYYYYKKLEEKSPNKKHQESWSLVSGIGGDFMHHSSQTLVSESADQNKRFSNNKNIKNVIRISFFFDSSWVPQIFGWFEIKLLIRDILG